MSPMAQSEAMDSGYAWVVFVASFCCYMIIGGTFFTNGFLLLSMLNDYHWDLTSTALIGSLFSAFTSVLGPLSGWMVCKTSNRFTIMFGGLLMVIGCVSCYFVYNVKLMTFTYALIGVGVGFVYVPVASIPSYNFSRYLNIVSGISASGAGFGTLLYSVIVPNSLQTYSLRGTFFVLAGMSAHICLFGALCRPNKIEKEKHHKNNDSYTDDRNGYVQLLKNLPLLMFCLSIFCWSMGVSIVLIFLPMYCQHFGSTDQQTAMVFSFIGGANILSRILTGIAANADNINELSLYVGSFGISGIASLLLPLYAQTFTGQLVYGIIQSLHTGGVYACLNSINIRLVGISHVAMATGLEMFFCGSGLLVGPPLGAMVKTYLKSMDMIFIIAGITFLTASFSGMLMTIVPSPLIKKLQNEDTLIVTQKMLPILDDAETIPLNSKRHPPKEANPMLG